MKALESNTGGIIVNTCLQLMPHLAVRPGELRAMEWGDINFGAKEWRYNINKTQTGHIVPLSSYAFERLRFIQTYTGNERYVFHGIKDKSRPISDMALTVSIRRLGFDIVPHSFRASFRTLGDEVLNFRADCLELQLGHKVLREPRKTPIK